MSEDIPQPTAGDNDVIALAMKAFQLGDNLNNPTENQLEASLRAWQTVLQHPGISTAPEPIRAMAEGGAGIAANGLSEYQGMTYLDMAIEYLSRAVSQRADPIFMTVWLHTLGKAFCNRYATGRDLADLGAGIDAWRKALILGTADSRDHLTLLENIASAYRLRHEHLADFDDLASEISVRRRIVDLTEPDSPEMFRQLEALGERLWLQYNQTAALTDLYQIIDVWARAADLEANDEGRRAQLLHNIVSVLRVRYLRTGRSSDIDLMLDVLHRALEAPVTQDLHYRLLLKLGDAQQLSFQRRQRVGDLEGSLASYGDALSLATDNTDQRQAALIRIGEALRLRYLRTGRMKDLNECISKLQEAQETGEQYISEFIKIHTILALALDARRQRTGRADDGERALLSWQLALAAVPTDSPDRIRISGMFSASLRDQVIDGESAFTSVTKAFDTLRLGGLTVNDSNDIGTLPSRLDAIAGDWYIRYRSSGDFDDLRTAIRIWDQAVERAGDNEWIILYFRTRLVDSRAEMCDADGALDELANSVDRLASATETIRRMEISLMSEPTRC